MAKAAGFSNVCKLFVCGCGCASFDYICYTLFFFYIRMLFFQPRLNILIFLPILG